MTNELKPCPFCGSKSGIPWKHEEWCFLRKLSDKTEDWWTGGLGDAIGLFDLDKADAHQHDRHSDDDLLKAWNTRTERTCKMRTVQDVRARASNVAVECSECGKWFDAVSGNYCPNCGAKVVDE